MPLFYLLLFVFRSPACSSGLTPARARTELPIYLDPNDAPFGGPLAVLLFYCVIADQVVLVLPSLLKLLRFEDGGACAFGRRLAGDMEQACQPLVYLTAVDFRRLALCEQPFRYPLHFVFQHSHTFAFDSKFFSPTIDYQDMNTGPLPASSR